AHLDRRADVFGLGAILCEILTGKPPYVGRSTEEVRRKAANGVLADALARLDGCGADHELIALTKACLAAEAIDRPRDAREVADGLSAYLDGVQEWLRAVLEAAEPDDAWGRRVWAACRETDKEKRQAALEALARSADVTKVPARALVRLAGQVRLSQAAELLRRAQQHNPADFWVNHDLG